MNGYLLDTSICVFLLRGNTLVEEKLNNINVENCYITDIVVAELLFGVYYSGMIEENLQKMKEFIAELKVIPLSQCIDLYAKEKARLWKLGKKIEVFDLLIGCAAKANDLIIVTHNVKHFSHIEGLKIENWLER